MNVSALEDPQVALQAAVRENRALRDQLRKERAVSLRIARSAVCDVVPERRALWRLLVKRLEG